MSETGRNHYLFVISPRRDDKRSSRDIIKYRAELGTWPLNRATYHQTEMRLNDRILFYVAGNVETDARKVIASARLLGNRVESERSDDKIPAWLGLRSRALYDIPFGEVTWLNTAVDVRPLVPDLEFVRSKASWHSYFQGGVRRISPNDYLLFLRAASSNGAHA